MVQCGAVWCSVVTCGAVWCGDVQCGAVRHLSAAGLHLVVCGILMRCIVTSHQAALRIKAVYKGRVQRPCTPTRKTNALCRRAGDSLSHSLLPMHIQSEVAAVCCSVLQCVAVCCSVLQCVAVCCSVLQCVAVCCSVLQCVAVYCSELQRAC